MLGFAEDASNAVTARSKFGIVSTDFITDDIICDGTESHIALCAHNARTDGCDSTEAAGVICGVSEEGM